MPIGLMKKKLPLEKALHLARQTQAPLWHRSRPMLWMDEKILRILEPEFQKETWVLACYDPLAPWGSAATSCFETFFQRYASLGFVVGMLTTLPRSATEFPQALQEWIAQTHYRHVLVGDAGALIALALGAGSAPLQLLVISDGKTALRWSALEGSFLEFETRFQQWLRREDPGLPLIDPGQNEPWPKISEFSR